MTEWKQTQFEGYEVSDEGQIRHNGKILRGKKVIEFPGRIRKQVNRLVWEAFNGEIPTGKRVKGGPLLKDMYIAPDKQPAKHNGEKMIALREAGMSNTQIAQELGLTPGAVTHWFKRRKDHEMSIL